MTNSHRLSDKSDKYIQFALIVFLLWCSGHANAQVSRRYYPRLDMQVKNVPAGIDTVSDWINPYLSRQFVKNPQYHNGYAHNFYISLRHLTDLQIMGGPLELVAKQNDADSSEYPFSKLIYVDVKKSRADLNDLDLSVQGFLHSAKEYFHWGSGTSLYRASMHLVNEGRAHHENQRSIARIGLSGSGLGVSSDRESDYLDQHFDYLIDTLNHMLGTEFPHGMKSNDLADSLVSLGFSEEQIVDSLFFKDRSPKQQDSMLNLMCYQDGGIIKLLEYFTHTVKISGFPFNLRIPVATIDSAYRPAARAESDTLTMEILECRIELQPGVTEYEIIVTFSGKFMTADGGSTPMSYVFMTLYNDRGMLEYYVSKSQPLQAWVRWDY